MAPAKKPRRPASLDPVELLAAAGDRKAPPMVLVTGQDGFSRDAVLQELGRALLAEGFEGFDGTSIGGEEVSGENLVNQAEMMPMGGMAGGSRFILVRRAEKIRERELEPLTRLAGMSLGGSCVALVFYEAKGAALTALKKVAPVLEFPAPRDYQLARWLEAQARRLKLQLDPDAARALADLVGEDYVGAMSELQKAAINCGGKRITRQVIEQSAAEGRDTNVFHLADAVLSGESARSVGILRDLHDAGQSGFMILGLLESQLRKFLKMRAEVDSGTPARLVVQSASPTLPPAIQARMARQLEAFDEPRLLGAFRAARAVDRAIKGYGSGAELAHLESFIWSITRRGDASRHGVS